MQPLPQPYKNQKYQCTKVYLLARPPLQVLFCNLLQQADNHILAPRHLQAKRYFPLVESYQFSSK